MNVLRLSLHFILFSCLTYAELKWESQLHSIEADVSETKAAHKFKFTNSGDEAVVIYDLKSSCGCTTAKLEKRLYLPGESGEIGAFFKFGNRQGEQTNVIQVYTDRDEEPYSLTLKVDIPRLIEIYPNKLYWDKGDRENKDVLLKIEDDSVEIKSVEAADTQLDTELITTEKPGLYVLKVTPPESEESFKSTVRIAVQYAKSETKSYYIYILVK